MKYGAEEYLKECLEEFADAATDLGASLEGLLGSTSLKSGDVFKATKKYEISDRNFTLMQNQIERAIKLIARSYVE